MVLQGQFLERSVLLRCRGVSLDGLYHRGARPPACVIAPPHPLLGGSVVSPAVAELAWALTRAGHATLRFDWHGVGASQGTRRTGEGALGPAQLGDEIAALSAACDQLAQTQGPRSSLCAIGCSFGAAVALALAADSRIERLVLVAPPTAAADFAALARLEKPVLVVAAHRDRRCDRALLANLLAPLGERAKFEVIPHTDASFLRSLPELGRQVAYWLPGGDPLPSSAAGEAAVEAHAPPGELELPEGDGTPLEIDDG